MKKNLIINKDNITYLKTLPDNSIDCCVTDPPYGLKFLNKHWDYDVPSKELWQEVLRVLKPGAHLLSFGGTRTYHRLATAIEDAGFEIRDQLNWLYGQGFPKSKNLGKEDKNFEGWGTNLKPANEPIVLARKPISEKTIALNFQKWGTGGINIEACRVPIKDDSINSGRWPANVILTHHPECKFKGKKNINENAKPVNYQTKNNKTAKINLNNCKKINHSNFIKEEIELYDCHPDCPYNFFPPSQTSSSTTKSSITPNKRKENIKFNRSEFKYINSFSDQGSTARFFYCAKASNKEKGNTTHPTVKPVELMKYLIKLVCPPYGTVLDPFAGTSTTGLAAKQLNINYIMIEKEKEYYDFSKERLKI